MAKVTGPPPPPGPKPPSKPTAELKARNAAGKQARAAPKSQYMRPHRVHSEQEEAVAFERHRNALLEAEAAEHAERDVEALQRGGLEEEEDDTRVKGLNFDEERKKRGRQRRDDEDGEGEHAEEAAEAAKAAHKQGFAQADATGRYFQDMPTDRLGDPSLRDPEEMKRALGPSVRFAQHAMLLAEEQLKNGAPRGEALELMASLYVGLSDKAYAQKALRDFGPASGIIDLYPLELMEHLLAHVPGFCSKVKQGRFFSSSADSAYRAKAGEIIALRYDPELRVRGFAVRGGDRPGYLFEPVDPPGTYHLVFQTAGRYQILVSAIRKDGWLMIEELSCEIEPGEAASLEAQPTVRRERLADSTTEGEPDEVEGPDEKKDDLRIHFPRRI